MVKRFLFIMLIFLFVQPGHCYINNYPPDTPWILDRDGVRVYKVDPDGATRTRNQDQTTPLVIIPLHQTQGQTTLAADAVIDTYTITLTDPTGFVNDNLIIITDVANTQVYYARQVGAPAGNVITVDRPIDFTFAAGLDITTNRTNMNVNGSSVTQVFGVRQGIDLGLNITVDITRVIIIMYTATAPTLTDFGDITSGLTTGVTLRKRDGNRQNIFNFKQNGELASFCYDVQFLSAIGAGQDGLVARLTFGGPDKMGAVVRIDPIEDLELIIKDNLTTLTKFEIIAEGAIAIP